MGRNDLSINLFSSKNSLGKLVKGGTHSLIIISSTQEPPDPAGIMS
jgi:hypothetical protein